MIGQAMQLAVQNHRAGKFAEAEKIYRQVLDLQPDQPDALHLLGVLVHQAGRTDLAIELIQRAIAINPNIADYHNNLGRALWGKGRLDEAIASLRRAIQLKPDLLEAHANLGIVLRDRGLLDEALDTYRNLLRLKPDFAEAHNNLAVVLRQQGRLDEAIDSYRNALRFNPDYAEAHNNLGISLHFTGRYDKAIDAYRNAVRLKPDYAEARHNLALTLLLKENFAEGWPEYEWRWRCKGIASPPRRWKQPRWDGAPLNGQTILLYADQGFGDAIQFVRYAPMVAGRGGRVVVGCPLELARLFRSNPDLGQIVSGDQGLPHFDLHCPLASLPLVFQTRMESIPARVPYLNADPALVEMWRQKLAPSQGKLRVALSWAGNPAFRGDRNRSLPFDCLTPLGGVRGATFFSLQKGEASQHAKNPPPGMDLIDLGPELTDFADTAAVMSLMDVIIAIDSSVCHLAGALARPVWLLLQSVPEWRWLLNRDDSPWYPTMRLFRQKSTGDWSELIGRVAQGLGAFR
ncbi:MAG TPA: tetratricopeptide repeat-containing glycosyltransferase family protein [Tepidisphaeraceae bacterium]|jgi:Flp pilus assembly protein TadD|nr:tetratricopeptide repeat-containing glycosyltransferase family protein [Tepidisphaeraceae bacterium]